MQVACTRTDKTDPQKPSHAWALAQVVELDQRKMATPTRFEPVIIRLEGECSLQLSDGAMFASDHEQDRYSCGNEGTNPVHDLGSEEAGGPAKPLQGTGIAQNLPGLKPWR